MYCARFLHCNCCNNTIKLNFMAYHGCVLPVAQRDTERESERERESGESERQRGREREGGDEQEGRGRGGGKERIGS